MGAGAVERVVVAAIRNYGEYRKFTADGRGVFAVSVFAVTGGVTEADILAALPQRSWAERQLEEGPLEVARGRARTLAMALVQQGEDGGRVEQVLAATGFHPSIAAEAARWALRRARARATPRPTPARATSPPR